MNRFFPEGKLFSYSFYGFSLVNMALGEPENQEFRAAARKELEGIIRIVEDMANEPPFLDNRNLTPKGGIIPGGQANLLRAGYVILGGSRKDIIESFHRASEELHRAFMKSKAGSLETYPTMVWPVDSCCGLESLRLHDFCYRTSYSEAGRRWEKWMGGHLEKRVGDDGDAGRYGRRCPGWAARLRIVVVSGVYAGIFPGPVEIAI